ncbi:MAG: hypothetical protein ABIH99_00430 [Candidatus Micrarchaeota archaeon]
MKQAMKIWVLPRTISPRCPGFDMEESLRCANSTKLRMLSFKEIAQRMLLKRDERMKDEGVAVLDKNMRIKEKQAIPKIYWTGTLLAFEEPNKKLGEYISFSPVDSEAVLKVQREYIIKVPKKYIGARNLALVAEHGFTKDGKPAIQLSSHPSLSNVRLVLIPGESLIHAIENFPQECGFYYADEKFWLPFGKPLNGKYINETQKVVFLMRTVERIGLIPIWSPPDHVNAAVSPLMNYSIMLEDKVRVESKAEQTLGSS